MKPKFKVGDVVCYNRSIPSAILTVTHVNRVCGTSMSTWRHIYKVDNGGLRPDEWVDEDYIVPAPVLKKYEIVRVVMAASEDTALAQYATSSGYVVAREIK